MENGMTNNNFISAADMMLKAASLAPMGGNELSSVWKKVVSKVHSYKDEAEDSERRMPIGERLAGNTRVIDLKNGILLIETDHPGWIQYLKLYQKFILNGLKMSLPKLKISSLAFRVAGSQVSLSEMYEEQLAKGRKVAEKKLEKQEKELAEYEKNKVSENPDNSAKNPLPPEVMAMFDNIRQSMLTNSDNK